jgi:hypothetical protein
MRLKGDLQLHLDARRTKQSYGIPGAAERWRLPV